MKSRTEGAIALLPTGNLQGSVKLLHLHSKSVVTRDKWTPLPIPDEVTAYIKAAVGKGMPKDPVYRMGNINIGGQEDDGDVIFIDPEDILPNPEVPPTATDCSESLELLQNLLSCLSHN
jgi:hypothetical protein